MNRQCALIMFASLFMTSQAAYAQSSFQIVPGQQVGISSSGGGQFAPGGVAGNYVALTTVTSTPSLNFCFACSVISLNQFAATTDLNNDIAAINLVLHDLKNEVWTGAALAASLTPTLPTDGNQNQVNFSSAIANGQPAVSANYARVDGPYDFVAGVAVGRSYSLAKVGVGFSW